MILLIIFRHNGERHSIKIHTLVQRQKKPKEVCIDFLSGVCFAVRDSLMSLQAEFQRGKP